MNPSQILKQVPKKKKQAKEMPVETKPEPRAEAKAVPKIKIPEREMGWSVIEGKRGSARKAKAE